MPRSIGRRAAVRGGVIAALVAVSMFVAVSSASAYGWNVPMTAAQQCASHLPCDAGASGNANIFTGSNANQLCGTFTWSGIHGAVGFGHIHQAADGQPENIGFTINLFGPPTSLSGFPSGTTGCTVVPSTVQAEMARFPMEFMVTIHTTSYPGGAIRGELGSGNPFCQISQALCVGATALTGEY
ncbi:MAG: CHRD domain-containing protein [Gaiellaceae bacterium]